MRNLHFNDEFIKNDGTYDLDFSKLNYGLLLFLVLAWLIVYFSQISGVKSVGKISWVTAILPYFCLTSLLIANSFQPGAYSVGVTKLLSINATHLATFEVWSDAATQIFYSQGIVWGVLINFASHNNYRMDVFRHNLRLSLINAGTSIYGSLIIFTTLGSLAYRKFGGDIAMALANFDEVVGQGYQLAFVIYPVAISQMSYSTFWSIVFFSMMTLLGLGSQVGTFLCFLEGTKGSKIVQAMPKLFKRFYLEITILFSLFLGLPMVTSSGRQWVELFDWSICAIGVFICAFLEMVSISWIYGIEKFLDDIESMMEFDLPYRNFWIICWKYVTPAISLILTILKLIGFATTDPFFAISTNWPLHFNLIGWLLLQVFGLVILVYYLITEKIGTDEVFYRRSRLEQDNEDKTLISDSNRDSDELYHSNEKC